MVHLLVISVLILPISDTGFDTPGCYNPNSRITYPSDTLVDQYNRISYVNTHSGLQFGCASLGLNSETNTMQYRCPISGDIDYPPSTTATTTTTTNATPTPTCTGNSKGKKRGDGHKDGYCLTSANRINSCTKGECDGPSPILPLPTNCKKGVQGKKNGRGLTNYCCTSNDDCQDICINGLCSHYTGRTSSPTTKKTTTIKLAIKAAVTPY